jgi:hypothetical protein
VVRGEHGEMKKIRWRRTVCANRCEVVWTEFTGSLILKRQINYQRRF